VHFRPSYLQWLQDPVNLTFNAISTYGRLGGTHTNELSPEDEDLPVETYVGAYISFNINYSNGALVGIC
jgi:hypothetical protein